MKEVKRAKIASENHLAKMESEIEILQSVSCKHVNVIGLYGTVVCAVSYGSLIEQF